MVTRGGGDKGWRRTRLLWNRRGASLPSAGGWVQGGLLARGTSAEGSPLGADADLVVAGSCVAMRPVRPFECDRPMLEASAKGAADEGAAIACDELKTENLSLKARPHLSVP